jgi:[ribosomal protein S5]-alanine N-acetyltransferase
MPMYPVADRLSFGPVKVTEFGAYCEYKNTPEHLRYTSMPEMTLGQVGDFIARRILWNQEVPRENWSFSLSLNDTLVGNASILRYPRSQPEDEPRRAATVGFEIAHPYWGQGYATEALRALLNWGFEALDLHRIWGDCVAENAGSWRAMEKLG